MTVVEVVGYLLRHVTPATEYRFPGQLLVTLNNIIYIYCHRMYDGNKLPVSHWPFQWDKENFDLPELYICFRGRFETLI